MSEAAVIPGAGVRSLCSDQSGAWDAAATAACAGAWTRAGPEPCTSLMVFYAQPTPADAEPERSNPVLNPRGPRQVCRCRNPADDVGFVAASSSSSFLTGTEAKCAVLWPRTFPVSYMCLCADRLLIENRAPTSLSLSVYLNLF